MVFVPADLLKILELGPPWVRFVKMHFAIRRGAARQPVAIVPSALLLPSYIYQAEAKKRLHGAAESKFSGCECYGLWTVS